MLLIAIFTLLGAFLAFLDGVAAAPANALRQTNRYDVVKRASQTRPKRATISGGALCSEFFLQDSITGLFVRDGSKGAAAGSNTYALIDAQGPVDRVRSDGTRLVFTGTGSYFGASTNTANVVRSNIFAGRSTALICAVGPGAAVRCRRDLAVPGSFDDETWATSGNAGTQILGIGPPGSSLGVQRRLVAVCG